MTAHEFKVVKSAVEYTGFRFQVRRDAVVMPGGETADRVYLTHPGAVAVVALDEAGRVPLIKQYRHPVGQRLWEIPAGLRDVEGEDPAETARRELAEEVDLVAGRMDHVIDVFPTPGCSNEKIVVFLARDLTPVPAEERHVRTAEEAELTLRWWELDEAVKAVLSGEITNGVTVAGLLAAASLRNSDHSL